MPQNVWTAVEERQYEHIKEGEKERGKSDREAREIAARTVNKQRRLSGKTRNKTTMGTGNPNVRLEDRSVAELRNLARELGVRGRSRMRKTELIRNLRG